MKQLLVRGAFVGESRAEIPVTEPIRHRLRKVLRLRAGATLKVADGIGRWRQCRWDGRALVADGELQANTSPGPPLTIAVGLLKGPRWQILLEKVTETGADRVVPLVLEHCVVQPRADKRERQVQRWQTIVDEAFEQCGRSRVPAVLAPIDLMQLCTTLKGALWFADERAERGDRFEPAPEPVTIAIGPEGGWSESERQRLAQAGARSLWLGPSVLRAETAAIVATALFEQVRQTS